MMPFQMSEHKGDTISHPLLRLFKVKVDTNGIWQAEHLGDSGTRQNDASEISTVFNDNTETVLLLTTF